MNNIRQDQVSGDDSISMQAARDIIMINGISSSEARQIAVDVFNANFPKLQDEAQRIAQERVEELVEAFLVRLQKEDTSLDELKNPDMQYILFSAQKDYARSGKKDLKEILVDILIKRTKTTSNEKRRIIFNEAIEIAPKLTSQQLNAISVCFYIKYFRDTSVHSLETFNAYLISKLLPLCKKVARDVADYMHIEYTGAGALSTVLDSIFSNFYKMYPEVLSIGFDETDIERLKLNKKQQEELFIPCLRNKNKWQIPAINYENIGIIAGKLNLNNDQISGLKKLHSKSMLSAEAFKEELSLIDKSFAELCTIWDNIGLGQLRLTTVGIALAHANIKKTLGIELNIYAEVNM